MKKRAGIMFIVCLFLVPGVAASQPGYHRQPWGSATWIGPGRPPHWPSPPVQYSRPPRPGRPVQPIAPEKPIDPEWGVRPPGPNGGYWQDKKRNRWYYHRYRRPGIVYYREPRVETIIIEKEKVSPVIIPARRRPSPLQCGGQTRTRRDPQTGEVIIEYVTSAQNCP